MGGNEDDGAVKDDLPLRRKITEKVRVSLSEKDKGNIQEWRKNYIAQENVALTPELYSNKLPSEKTVSTTLSTKTTSSTTTSAFSTTEREQTTSTASTTIPES